MGRLRACPLLLPAQGDHGRLVVGGVGRWCPGGRGRHVVGSAAWRGWADGRQGHETGVARHQLAGAGGVLAGALIVNWAALWPGVRDSDHCFGEAVGRFAHERRMRRHADGQLHRLAHAAFGEHRERAIDGIRMSTDHDLAPAS